MVGASTSPQDGCEARMSDSEVGGHRSFRQTRGSKVEMILKMAVKSFNSEGC